MREKGFTLLELMIVIAILASIATMAGPSVSGFIDKRKIINAAEAIYSQLLFARSQSISRSQNIGVNFGYTDTSDAKTWLMGISNNIGCDVIQTATPTDITDDCTLVVDDGDGLVHGTDTNNDGDPTVVSSADIISDTDDLVYHVISGVDFNGVELDDDGDRSTPPVAPGAFAFDFTRGTTTIGRTIYLRYQKGDSDYELRVVVGRIGRVKICTPDAAGRVPGYITTTEPTGCDNP